MSDGPIHDIIHTIFAQGDRPVAAISATAGPRLHRMKREPVRHNKPGGAQEKKDTTLLVDYSWTSLVVLHALRGRARVKMVTEHGRTGRTQAQSVKSFILTVHHRPLLYHTNRSGIMEEDDFIKRASSAGLK